MNASQKRVGVGAVMALLMTLLFVIDIKTPLSSFPSIAYCGVILLAAAMGGGALMVWMAAACTLLIGVAHFAEPSSARFSMIAVSRALEIAVIWMTVALIQRRDRSLAMSRRLARELARSNTALEHFAAVVAHDLRSPMTSLGLYLDLLDRKELDASERQMLDQMRASIVEMNSLIQGILEHARLSIDPRNVRCDAEEALATVLRSLDGELRGIRAQIDHDPLPVVACDRVHTIQVLQNLISNAIRYRSPKDLHVKVSAEPAKDGYKFCVRDNGIGIGADQSAAIFEMFRQGDARDRDGHGIGLSTCKRIVESYGGRIWVESQPGAGSAFFFTLPTVTDEPAHTPPTLIGAAHKKTADVG